MEIVETIVWIAVIFILGIAMGWLLVLAAMLIAGATSD